MATPRKTTRPTDLDSLRHGDPTNEDATANLLRDLRNGFDDDLDDSLTSSEPERSDPITAPTATPSPGVNVPEVVARVLAGACRQEFIEIAKLLDAEAESFRYIRFVTPIGDIRCRINWISCAPSDIKVDGMFFIKVRAGDMMFTPKPGATFDVGFDGYPDRVVSVVCLAEPQRLYPGVDLLCFMAHNRLVEKTGRLKEGAPSVVSGGASNSVQGGEPVLNTERATELSEMQKEALVKSPTRDWDQPRG
jgi:hypothetical protein